MSSPFNKNIAFILCAVVLAAMVATTTSTQKDHGKISGVLLVRHVRISTESPPLVLGQVEVFVGRDNVAPIMGRATQSSVLGDDISHHGAQLAIDGTLSATGFGGGDAARTKLRDRMPWWEVDLGHEMAVGQVNLWLQDRGRFPHPYSAWYIDEDVELVVELLCARRSVKWSTRVHRWKDVITIPIK